MQITQTTLRQIIKEELDATMNEDEDALERAEYAAQEELTRHIEAVMRKLIDAGSNPDEASNIAFRAARMASRNALN